MLIYIKPDRFVVKPEILWAVEALVVQVGLGSFIFTVNMPFDAYLLRYMFAVISTFTMCTNALYSVKS